MEQIKELFWARVKVARETGSLGRGFRYDLEDYLGSIWPEKLRPGLIPMSVGAAKLAPNGIRQHGEGKPLGLAFEHSVPLKVIGSLLLEAETQEAMMRILERYVQIVWVTKDEDIRLNQMGLRSKMPADWDRTTYARYVAAGIELNHQHYVSAQKEA
ncbi:hypothetical protein [Tateyamaria sp.]|uniref:hypothetical protein n=1 Tax=Tateyamaria sp. TaxID=1929288 RepID=UPI00329DE8E3